MGVKKIEECFGEWGKDESGTTRQLAGQRSLRCPVHIRTSNVNGFFVTHPCKGNIQKLKQAGDLKGGGKRGKKRQPRRRQGKVPREVGKHGKNLMPL